MKKLFEKQEIILLLGSTVIDDYPELKSTITAYPDLVDNELHKLPSSVQTLFPGEYARLVAAAEKDWTSILSDEYPLIVVGEDPNHTHCELCGNTQCERLYPIRNLKGDAIKYVGSTCIERFNINGKESVDAIEARHRALKKFHELNSRFPGIVDNYMHNAQSKTEVAPYLIPNPLYRQYQENFRRIRALGEQFQAELNDDVLNQIAEQIQLCLDFDAEYCANIDSYCESAKGNWLIPTRKMIERMRSEKKASTIQKLRNEKGLISSSTLKDIDEIDFINTYVLPNIEAATKDMPITFCKLFSVNAGGYGANATALPIRENHPHFFVRHYDIAKEFGKHILTKQSIKRKGRLLSLLRLTPDTPILHLLKHARTRLGYYKILLVGVIEERDDLYIRHNDDIIKVPLRSYVQHHINFFVDPSGVSLINPMGFLDQHGESVSKEEWNKILSSQNKQDEIYLFKS